MSQEITAPPKNDAPHSPLPPFKHAPAPAEQKPESN